jgi:hypothetical protein
MATVGVVEGGEMRRLLLVAVLVAAVVVPSALAADPNPADYKNAAKYCMAVREAKGAEAFATVYGTNTNKKNAFGKCVSKAASVKAEKRKGKTEGNAANAECKKQQHADAAKFAQDYKNFGQCMKAHKGKSTDDSDGDDSEADD